ncbi:MAG: two-component regulator propeller domain-containing protein [Bacteroidota bacterium]
MLRYILVVVCLLICLSVQSQVYNVSGYSTNQDLHSQVISVHEDKDRFIWFGTHGGVYRFDGNEFIHFGADEGLEGTFMRDILEDEEGILWMATDNGLTSYNGEAFENLTIEDGLPSNDLTCLIQDRDGNLLIGTQAAGVFLYDGSQVVNEPFEWIAAPVKPHVQAILQSKHDDIWIATLEGLFLKEANSSVLDRPKNVPFPNQMEVYALLEDSEEQIWIGTNRGLYMWDGQQFTEVRLTGDELPDTEVHCMVEDSKGQLWLGTRRGIIRYNEGEFIPMESSERFLDYQMRSTIEDFEGNIWFGTDGGGARKITVGVFESYGMQNRLSSNLAKSFLEDDDGHIWISTRDRGINVWDAEQKKVLKTYSSKEGLGGDGICSAFEDKAGNFWFASYNGTLTKYNDAGFTVFRKEDGLLCNAVYVVREDRLNRLWIGTDDGIFILENDIITQHYQEEDGLTSNIIYSLMEDHMGRMWIGMAGGICLWDKGTISPYDTGGEVGENVFSMVEDTAHHIWIGSSIGLSWIKDTAEWLKISGARGADIVVSLMIEHDTSLWIGTENGSYLLREVQDFDSKNYQFNHYTRKDGLPSLECNAQAAFLDSKGNIWFGTSEGTIMSPAETPRDISTHKPPLYITEVVGAQDSNWESLGYTLDEWGLPIDLVLDYTENRLEFEFIAVSLKSPKQIEYKFILKGLEGFEAFDKASSTRETRILFPNLPAGNYTFQVTAKREAESWDYSYTSEFTFKVLPPFWASWWFLTSLGLILIVTGLGIYQIFMTRRKERQIRNRADMLQLEHQALYAMMNPHFTFNALQSIQYFIHRQDKKAANKFLSSFARLIRKNLESTKVDFISLGEEIERLKLYLSLEKMRFPEKFDYEVNVEPGIELSETQIPPMLLQPFVENSIKHGIMALDKDGLILVSVNGYGEEYLLITIEDNGIGIEASKARKKNRPSDHVSKGMQITLDRLALFAKMTGKQYSLDIGEIHESNGEVQGTLVKMILPVKTDESVLIVE